MHKRKYVLLGLLAFILIGTAVFAGDIEMKINGATDAVTIDKSDGSEAMRVTADGKVGIGTNTPNNNDRLTVKGGQIGIENNMGDTALVIRSGNGAKGQIRYNESADVFTFGYQGFQSNGQGLNMNSAGKVGIGTTAPKAKLDVVGEIRATGFFQKSKVSGYDATPLECVDVCVDAGGRMATVAEMYAHASAKKNICGFMWVLDDVNIGKVAVGYPMFVNRTTSGCGLLDTGDVPRISSLTRNLEWTSTVKKSCGCYGIR